MVYDYEKAKKAYEGLTYEQKQQFADKYKNDATVQQFAKDYAADIGSSKNSNTFHVSYDDPNDPGRPTSITSAAATGSVTRLVNSAKKALTGTSNTATTNTTKNWWDQGNGRYSYNPVSGYYEKVVNKSDNSPTTIYGEDENHYGILDDKNKTNPVTTYTGEQTGENVNPLLNAQTQAEQAVQNTNVDLTGGDKNVNMNNWGEFNSAVNNKLQTAFGLQDLNALKEKYPEQYSSLVQALNSVAPVWNSLDPSQRQLLEGQLQAIIGTAVGAGSDTSQLNVLSESILSKFKEPDSVKKFVSDVTRLKTEGMTTVEIAKQMGVSEDMVQQGILAANNLDNKLGEYFELTGEAAKDITEPYDTKMERLEEEKKIALERANRDVEWLKQDFDTNYERQQKVNETNKHNADFISGQYGFGFSKRGIEGLEYVETQAKQIIDDMVKNYDRTKLEMAEGITDIIRNWEWNNEDLMKASEDALTNAKNVYTSNMLAIQQQYGTVGMQAQQQMANNVQNFITTAENIYDNALNRQQQNLSNLITNFSNLNALSYSNITLRNAQIQQFQNESMNMNRNQLQSLAQQLGMDTASMQDLVSYQAQAVANTLNGYIAGSGVKFQNQIQSLLDSGYTPNQVLQSIMNSADFKAMQQTSGDSNWAVSGGILYNKATGQYENLNATSNERGSAGSGTIYNKSTGEVKTATGKTVSTTNSNGGYQQVKLTDEEPNVDTGIKNVYGSNVKLTPTVGGMLNEAYNKLLAQGIELKIGDSYRSYATQKQAYENGKAGVVSPDKSFHCLGQAFDVVQDGSMYTDEVVQALLDAGFTRPNAKEPRHWSYGEGKDAFGGKPRNTDAYALAQSVLNGNGSMPAKNAKNYSEVVTALDDLVTQKYGKDTPTGMDLINWSAKFGDDSMYPASDRQSIASTISSLYSTDMLMNLLDENDDIIGPILSRMEGWNPYNADYAAIRASIMQMSSNIARGFGEKGVLTDADIERYMKTIPNEKMGKKAREVVGTLLKAKLYRGLVDKLETDARAGVNVKDMGYYYQQATDWLNQNGFGNGNGRGLKATIKLEGLGRS